MATHDYVIANGTGAAVRSDLNGALAAIVSQNSSATEPSPSYAYQRWADITAGVMKMRNGANNAWITLYQLDGEWSTIAFENGTAAAPSIYFKDSGTDTGIYSPGANQVAISTDGTGRLFVASAGNVGIGVSDPGQALVIGGGTNGRARIKVTSGAGNLGKFEFSTDSSSTASTAQIAEITASIVGTGPLTSSLGFATNAGNSLNTAMTIDSSQRLLVGTTNPSIQTFASASGVNINADGTIGASSTGTTFTVNRTTSDGTVVGFNRAGNPVGSISVTTTATAYNTSSDYRLKENVTPITNGITRFQQLKPSQFNFIVEPDKTVEGFLAHEAQAVVPECVTGEKDAVDADGNPVYQGIDQSKLVPLLTAALQEAIARIETLETRLSVLEGA